MDGGDKQADIAWQKSSYSNGANSCLEVSFSSNGVLVRDSKDPGGAVLSVHTGAWYALLCMARIDNTEH